MKIPMPTPAILSTLRVELVGERRFVEANELYLEESSGEFTMTVIQATRKLNEPRWIVTQAKKEFALNSTATAIIPASASEDVIVNVSGTGATTQRHSVSDIKKLARALTLPGTFHGNDLSFDSKAALKIGCQTILVSKVLELAAQLPEK